MAKIRNFDSFVGCSLSPHFCADKREIWHGRGPLTHGPLPRAKFHVYRGNVSPLLGEKPIFGPRTE